jgi:two-component system, NtrC family, sensor histidine kinase HydH
MPTETLFAELKRYVGWSREDEQSLRRLHVEAAPHFARIADQFYERILSHEGARQALVGGESRVGHLKVTLIAWMDRLLSGPWDEEYFAVRCRIGRVHVRIALPQHYMFGAMNQLRLELGDVIVTSFANEPDTLHRLQVALGKALDLELAIMRHTYREDLLSQQQQQERLATFGQLVGSIGHELRNPLGVIESSLYVLGQRTGEDPRAKKHVDRIAEQVRVSNGIITALLDMIRDRPPVRTPVSLAATVAGVVGALAPPPALRILLDGLEALPTIDGDAGQLRTVVMNLVENAVHAAGDAGEVVIRGLASDSAVELSVEDSGPGVDAQTQRRLFEPLVTTKATGVGLGLALVRRIVVRHGGTVEYAPRAGHGARFVVRLPLRTAGDG